MPEKELINICIRKPTKINIFFILQYISHKWYEVFRYNAVYQKGCECSRAIYSLNSDNTVKVYNCCKKPEGNECATGKAIVSYPDHLPLEGKLNVAFGDQRKSILQVFFFKINFFT